MIAPPTVPRLPSRLEAWEGSDDTELEIEGCVVDQADFNGVRTLQIDASRLQGITFTGALLDKLDITDSECMKAEAAACKAYKATLTRVGVIDCRFTGADFGEARFEDCTFRNVKLDDTGFRYAVFKRVRFENCVMTRADFGNAVLSQVTFTGCKLDGSRFASAVCKDVDVSTEDTSDVKSLLGLKGAVISDSQLIQLAPLLAAELGFQVRTDP